MIDEQKKNSQNVQLSHFTKIFLKIVHIVDSQIGFI